MTYFEDFLLKMRRGVVLTLSMVVLMLFMQIPGSGGNLNGEVSSIRIEKEKRVMTLFDSKGRKIKNYKIAIGSGGSGKKERMGDKKTPEGEYFIDGKNSKSRYWKSLHLSYPNKEDTRLASSRAIPAGGDIMIHGIGKMGWIGHAHLLYNWTAGCIAVTNEEAEEIFRATPLGTKVTISR